MQIYLYCLHSVIFQDLLSALDAKTALEREAKLFQERLLAAQRAWEVSKQELNQLRKNCQQLDLSLKASRDAAAGSQSQISSFREKLAKVLGSGLDMAGSAEDPILERIRELCIQEESKKRVSRPWPLTTSSAVTQHTAAMSWN